MKKLTSLSIFFPAYNDEKTIGSLIVDAYRVGKKITEDLEVIVINDGSQDNTGVVLQKAKKDLPGLKIITHKNNQGYGGALKSGFAKATKDFVFYTDGDGQYVVNDLVLLLEKMRPGVAVVNGYKDGRSDSFLRRIIGKFYTYFLKFIFGIKIKDVDCDFRLIDKKVFEKVSLSFDSGAICLELIKKIQDAGFGFAEVQVKHLPRKFGTSQFFTFERILKTLADDFKFWVGITFKKNGN